MKLTVSTHVSISRINLELAPKARKIVTPEIVSPYIEYSGDRLTESLMFVIHFRLNVEQYMITTKSLHISTTLTVDLSNCEQFCHFI